MLALYLLLSCVCLSVCLFVCHKPVLYRNELTNRADFRHGGFLLPITHRVLEKFGDFQNIGYFLPVPTLLHTFNCPLSGTTWVSRYQKGKTNLDFTEARDSEWQWNPLCRMKVCTSFQTDNHASTPPLNFLQARCPSCGPTNSVKALKTASFFWYFVPNSGIRKFCHSKSIALSAKLVVGPVCDNTYATVDESWLCATSWSTVSL